jgi:hypothetical protein
MGVSDQRERRRLRLQIAAHSAQVSGGGEADDSPRTVMTAPQYATTVEPAGRAGGGYPCVTSSVLSLACRGAESVEDCDATPQR